MTGAQVRKARQLLGWSMNDLAAASMIPKQVIRVYELTEHLQKPMFQRTNPEDRMTILQTTLEAAGVQFINGKQPGVKLRKPSV